jgi:ABC-type transporter Mla subunit MlaD
LQENYFLFFLAQDPLSILTRIIAPPPVIEQVEMPPNPAKKPHEIAGDSLIELAQKKVPEKAQLPAPEESKPRVSFAQKLGKLKPLLPILSGGLRMIDHGAVQALAQVLNVIGGTGPAQTAAHEELEHALAEMDASHRELRLTVQDQSVELKRIEDQLALVRQTAERSATAHEELAEDVKSLSNLVRTVGAGLAILLILLIILTGFLLVRRP